MDFVGFIDSKLEREDVLYCEHPMFKPEILKKHSGSEIRIIISIKNTGEIMQFLMDFAQTDNIDILCFVLWYKEETGDKFNVNRFLGYFRNQLITEDIPTIISNDCTAGRIYEALGLVLATPTINTVITSEEYLKIIKNPEKYLNGKIEPFGRIRPCREEGYTSDKDLEAGKVDDVTILFAHNYEKKNVYLQWTCLCELVNYNRIINVYSDMNDWSVMTFAQQKEFAQIKDEKIYISSRCSVNIGDVSVYMKENYFFYIWEAIENHFDLLGFINKEYI